MCNHSAITPSSSILHSWRRFPLADPSAGDQRADTVDYKARVVSLTLGGSVLTMTLYPDKAYYDSYFSLYPAYQIIGACIALVIITGIFVVYDRIVRNHFEFLRKQKEQIRIRAERAAAQQKSEFVTMVSHEIRTPLNVVSQWHCRPALDQTRAPLPFIRSPDACMIPRNSPLASPPLSSRSPAPPRFSALRRRPRRRRSSSTCSASERSTSFS